MIQLVEVLTRTEAWLRERGISSPRLEAELMLCHVLGLERLQLYLLHDRPLTDEELSALRPLVSRRGKREPLAWLLGSRAFHAIELEVEPGILVPRPDSETLVDAALEWIPEDADPTYVADIGCGSGAIGLAILVARPHTLLYATDLDDKALEVTRRNVTRLGLDSRVGVLKGDLLDPIPAARTIDWVVSNPPYIPTGDFAGLEPEVSQWEPRLALDGGHDGLAIYRRLVPQAAQRARKGVLVEIGIHQAGEVVGMFNRAGLKNVKTWKDLGGITRVIGGLKPA